MLPDTLGDKAIRFHCQRSETIRCHCEEPKATKQSGGIIPGVDSRDCFASLAMAPDCFASLAMAPDCFASLAMTGFDLAFHADP